VAGGFFIYFPEILYFDNSQNYDIVIMLRDAEQTLRCFGAKYMKTEKKLHYYGDCRTICDSDTWNIMASDLARLSRKWSTNFQRRVYGSLRC